MGVFTADKVLGNVWDSVNKALSVALKAGTNVIGKVQTSVTPAAPAAYRAAVIAADVIAAPAAVTTSKQAGGSVTAGVHKIKVVAVTPYGRTTATAGANVTTETTNLTVRAAFAQVTTATAYDIYCSTDADPLWVGRVTEAQRASGIKITAVGITGAGGVAGAVDIEAVGTGQASGTTAAVNTAYSIPASPIDTTGYQYLDIGFTCTRTGDAAAAALSFIPFFYNSRTTTYEAGSVYSLTFGGTAGNYQPMKQRIRIETRGNSAVAIVVASIAGTGMSVDMDAVPS
jgi:hypothetical protein